MELRSYQAEALERVREQFRSGLRSVLFVLPTGGGKTVVFSEVCRLAVARGGRVLVLAHRAELVSQASKSLETLGIQHGLIMAGRGLDLHHPVQVASVQTVARRLARIEQSQFTLLIVDEAHHTCAGTWSKVVAHFDRAKLLGVTATPARLDGRGLGDFYQAMVLGPSAAWLTEQGYLAQSRVFAPPIALDLSKVKTRMGEYDGKSVGEQITHGTVVGDVIKHYERYMNGDTAIAFCPSVESAESYARAFSEHGIASSSIDGTMTTEQRRQLLDDLGAGRLKVLTSCALIGEGVDVPSVGGCILLRPTKSESLHLQMIGRCLRPSGDKVAVILDHVGNVKFHGHHLEDREWTLEGRKKIEKGAPAIKVCPSCFAVNASCALQCEECGHVFAVKVRELAQVDGELVEIDPAMVTKERKAEQGSARTMKDLIAVGVRRGMKNPYGWAKHVLAARERKKAIA